MSQLSRIYPVARFFLPAVLTVVFPAKCMAHVKWFTESADIVAIPSFTRLEILSAASLLLLCVVAAKLLHQQLLRRGGIFTAPVSETVVPLRVAQYLLSIYFLGCALSGIVLAPHISAAAPVVYLCVGLQAVVSVLFLLNRLREVTALLMIILFVAAGLTNTTFFMEYLLFAGIAWLIYFNKRVPDESLMMVLRCSLGASLIALALMEKLLHPELAMNVLQQFPLNFMQQLGIPFSDLWFVLAAGMVELLIGLLFVMGLLVRTTTLVLLILMVASNSYFVIIDNHPLAMMELVGHLPVFAVGILMIFYSSNIVATKVEEDNDAVAAPRVAESTFSVESSR